MINDLNIQVCFEFLDGTVAIAAIPVWLESSTSLVVTKPGTMEDTYVHLEDVTKGGLRVYREWPPARILRFPLERRLKSVRN